MFSLDKRHWQWGALFLLAFVWGASFILMKRGLDAFTYAQIGALRIFFSFLILLPISIKNLKLLTRKNFGFLLASGLLGNFFPAFMFPLAQTQVPSSLAGILNGLTPFFTLIIGVLAFKSKPNKLQYIGIFVGFLGAAILVTNGNFDSLSNINAFALIIVFATIMYGINANIIRNKLMGLNGIQITSLLFFLIGPFAGVVLMFTNIETAVQSVKFWPSLLAVLTLATFASVILLFIYNNLIHKAGPIFASSSTYVIPFFALIWGLLDGEYISTMHLLSLAIILIGVYLASLKRIPHFGLFKP
ncbi:MAG: EamA family transporter [Bacteroidales bacterium]|nr:EamA family transporter [Bacteroidales bacterium]